MGFVLVHAHMVTLIKVIPAILVILIVNHVQSLQSFAIAVTHQVLITNSTTILAFHLVLLVLLIFLTIVFNVIVNVRLVMAQ